MAAHEKKFVSLKIFCFNNKCEWLKVAAIL